MNGIPTLELQQLAKHPEDNIQIASANKQTYTLTFFDGSSIKVVVIDPTQKYYNVDVNLSGYFFNQGISGLCGNFNGNAVDDVPGGGANCLVPPQSNYLTNGNKVVIPDFSATSPVPPGVGVCSFPPVAVNPPVVKPEALMAQRTGFEKVSLDSLPAFTLKQTMEKEALVLGASNATTPLISAAVAESQCAAALRVPACAQIVDPASYHKSCVSDSITSGSLNSVEATRLSYRTMCDTRTESMASKGSPIAKATAVAAQDALKCVNNCSGHGLCVASGCICDVGFTGTGCATNIKSQIH